MVQFIPRIPTGAEKFMQHLGNAASGIAGGFGDAFANQQKSKFSERLNQQKQAKFTATMKKMFPEFESTGNEDIDKAIVTELLKGKLEQDKFGRDRLQAGQTAMDDYNKALSLKFEENQMLNKREEDKFERDRMETGQKAMDAYNEKQELQYQKHLQDLELKDLETGKKKKDEIKKSQKDYYEATQPIRNALETVDKMVKLGAEGHLGRGTGVRGIYSPETLKRAGKYEEFGKSLVSAIAPLKITNKAEFEHYAAKIADPTLPDAEREGALEALKEILQQNLKNYAPPDYEEDVPQGTQATRQNSPSIMKTPQKSWNEYVK